MDDRRRAAIKYLVQFMFGEQDAWRKPQGVAQHYHADYWERFSSIPRLEAGERDQPVLQTLLQSDDAAVLDLLQGGPRRSAAVEDFERLIARDRLVGLFLPLVERRSEERPDSWEGQEPPGLIPLWRMWNRRWQRDELPTATILDQVKSAFDIAIPRNLGLVTDIEKYFVVTSPGVPELLGPRERVEAKAYCRRIFASTYQGRDEALSRNLNGAKAWTLLWLCWGLDRVRSRELEGLPFPEWPTLAATVIEAARHEPAIMLPQVACLVVSGSVVVARRSGLQYEFDEAAATRLFGNVRIVLDLFRGQDAVDLAGSQEVETVIAYLQR